jgi:hypothetical protein
MLRDLAKGKTRGAVRALRNMGIDVRQGSVALRGRRTYKRNRKQFLASLEQSGGASGFAWGRAYPVYGDRFQEAGQARGHYFHQDLIVAQEIFQRSPTRHVDVGSSLYGFVSHVASFMEVTVVDVRPCSSSAANVNFVLADLMEGTPGFLRSPSVSCLHALEHFGLGRYGDPINIDGWAQGLSNLCDMTENGGRLYLSVPITAKPRIEFDAHRVFAPRQILDALPSNIEVAQFHVVDDNGDLHRNVEARSGETTAGLGLDYGLGIWFLDRKDHVRSE